MHGLQMVAYMSWHVATYMCSGLQWVQTQQLIVLVDTYVASNSYISNRNKFTCVVHEIQIIVYMSWPASAYMC